MSQDSGSDLDDALAALPALDLPAERTEAVRARAHAVLAAGAPVRVPVSRARRTWRRAELGFALAIAAAQLFFAFEAASRPFR